MKSSKSGVHTFQAAAGATGNGTPLLVDGFSGVGVQVTGTFTGTVTLEGTIDGSTWVEIGAIDLNATNHNTKVKGITGPGLYLIDHIGGCSEFRARVSAWSNGEITALGLAFA